MQLGGPKSHSRKQVVSDYQRDAIFQGEGMQTTEMALKDLVSRGEITPDAAITISGNTQLFDDEPGRRPPRKLR